jgi:hypothetical protein
MSNVRPQNMTDDGISRLSEDLKERIRDLEHMRPEDWRQALSVLTDKSRERSEIQPSHLTALNVRITYDLVTAIHKMDQASTALARRLVILTWVLVVFTAALLVEPVVHFVHWLRL